MSLNVSSTLKRFECGNMIKTSKGIINIHFLPRTAALKTQLPELHENCIYKLSECLVIAKSSVLLGRDIAVNTLCFTSHEKSDRTRRFGNYTAAILSV